MISGKCKHFFAFFQRFFPFFSGFVRKCRKGKDWRASCISPHFEVVIRSRVSSGALLRSRRTAQRTAERPDRAGFPLDPGKRKGSKKSRVRRGAREEVQNRTQFNYLYLMAVPVSLTVTTLMPMMQLWSKSMRMSIRSSAPGASLRASALRVSKEASPSVTTVK